MAYEVVVVGGGMGGLTAAALLAARGTSVCLLERESRGLLSADVLDRFMLAWRFDGRDRSTFEGEDDLSNFYFFAFFDFDFFDDACNARWDFNDRFVGLEFHDRLTFGHVCAGRDHKADEVSGVDVLAEFR